MADLWTHTSEFTWLRSYIERLRARAVRDMEVGVDMEMYAVLRGYIQACDHIVDAPNRYMEDMRAAREAEEVNA